MKVQGRTHSPVEMEHPGETSGACLYSALEIATKRTTKGDSMNDLTNTIHCGDCVDVMRQLLPDESIDLTVTSPPYDNLRTYNGYNLDFESIARELYRVTKAGGVVVWVVGDATVHGSETGTSFRQALFLRDHCGFNLHDTMIYRRVSPMPPNRRYWHTFEYMFVFSKGRPKTFNPLLQPKKASYSVGSFRTRQRDGTLVSLDKAGKQRLEEANRRRNRVRDNIWDIPAGWGRSTADRIAFCHPAIFPERLAEDHILSWSNPGDLVLDPMCGSGTTCKMAMINDRGYIGIDVSEEYCRLARKRLEMTTKRLRSATLR